MPCVSHHSMTTKLHNQNNRPVGATRRKDDVDTPPSGAARFIMEQEIWKDIPDYEGIYQVSNLGSIRSLVRIDRKGRKRGGKFMQPVKTNDGYTQVTLYKNSLGKNIFIHRIVGAAFVLNPSNKPFINHKNSNREDNRSFNLEWITTSENNRHAYRNGLRKITRGDSHYASKLTSKQVLEIRSKYIPHEYSLSKISVEYNISYGAVQAIIERKTWTHI